MTTTTIQLDCSENYQLLVRLTDLPSTQCPQTHIRISSLLSSAKDPGAPQRLLDITLEKHLLDKLQQGIAQHRAK